MSSFPDPALKITIVSSMIQEGILSAFDKDEFYQTVLGKKYEHHDGLDKQVMNHLIDLPIDKHLTQLKVLQWDGSDELFFQIYEDWDGHDRVFYVKDLSGIERCANLEEVLFYAGLDTEDITPVGKLKKLTKAKLRGPGKIADLTPVAKLPLLKELEADAVENETNTEILKRFKSS